MSTNAELANEIALGYEYLKTVRERLNARPDRNSEPLMLPVDVRLGLVLHHLEDSVALLRREPTEGIALQFTQVRSIR